MARTLTQLVDQVAFLIVFSSGAFKVLGPYGGTGGGSGITFGEIQAFFVAVKFQKWN